MYGLVHLLIASAYLITKSSCQKCQHLGKEDAFPPAIPHQYFSDPYIDNYDEIIVIGDVHGCYKELQLLLDRANITGRNVLKILAGDLTRKGPNSTEVIRFVQNDPSVVAVKGNNDQKVLSIYYKVMNYEYSLSSEDEFIRTLTQNDLDFIHQLPYTISIPSLNAIVVHGGIRPGLPLQDHDAFDLMNVRNVVPDPECVGGYRPIKTHSKGVPWASAWKGPEHVYFGHDHFRDLQLYPFSTGVDTSCVSGKNLTGVFIKGPRTGQLVHQPALKQYVYFPSLSEAKMILKKHPKEVLEKL